MIYYTLYLLHINLNYEKNPSTFCCSTSVVMLKAQSVTWAHDIAPIFYNNSPTCHHDGGIAPFSLINYSTAYQQRNLINSDVTSHIMPPWPPDPTYKRYSHERVLSAQDILLINTWVGEGSPSGDTTTAPIAPVYTNGSQLGNPSLTLQIPTYTVPVNQTTDIYQCFAIPTNLLTDQFVTGLEIIPGDPSIVHHVLVYQDTTANAAWLLDSASPGPGYLNYGGIGVNSAILMGGWVPGSSPFLMPTNFGEPIYKNSYLVLQIHYPAGDNGKVDSTKLNLLLAPTVSRPVFMDPILNYFQNINQPLVIPADSIMTFNEHYTLPNLDISVLTVAPHCHLIGQNWLSYGITPSNDTIPMIRINDWNFHWQGFYEFRNIIKAPALTNLWAFCTYNNTAENLNNPNSPPLTVSAGENTTDEMMLVYFLWTPYQTGDENIVLDSTPLADIVDTYAITTAVQDLNGMVSTPQLYEAAPNPAKDETQICTSCPIWLKSN